ncbi:MAG: 1-acyl-sn-glycerol-3-phosphate acyltransferase [Armatimonadetes bacterium]|nr:1-acyl-sn-glycerol-3-phosphate acyltransferase [Armatimonadota bacterium]
MRAEFIPPRPHPVVMALAQFALPLFLPLHDQVTRIRLEPEARERLNALGSGRALLVVNHPSETEPVVMFGVSRLVRQPFYFVATHEIFHGARGWLVNHIGAFSIHRGRPDRTSLRMSRSLLAEQDRKLVIFPEGETHMENDRILPLHPGAIQIGFWALETLEQLGQPLSLPVVPVTVRYCYQGDPVPALVRGLERLEADLGLGPMPGLTRSGRLIRAGLVVLAGIEREYALPAPADPADLTEVDGRIAAVFRYGGGRVAEMLHVPFPDQEPVPVGLRILYNHTFDYQAGLAAGKSAYERRLHARRLLAARACLNDLDRLQNFMVIGGRSLAPPVRAERFGEVLWRLEREVVGRPRTRPLREAVVRVGEPLRLEAQFPAYRETRRKEVARCSQDIEARLRTQLEGMFSLGTPMPE